HILIDRDCSARTRNNYRIWVSSLCAWLVEKQYIDRNPIEKIKMLTVKEKKRKALTPEDLGKLNKYLMEHNPYFLLVCQFEYYTFIRPDELSNIKLCDINIKEQKVFIASTISKNRKDGMVGLNDSLIKMMIELNIFSSPNNSYLFGKDFKPSLKKSTARTYREYFNKVRAALKFPDIYQFYSLKDSGIRDLANAEGIVVARDQARHADVSTTNKYLNGTSMTVHEESKRFKGKL
ncbi:MAG: tyrosine-type recombinase/integrase, partial [Phocaeicola sp.]